VTAVPNEADIELAEHMMKGIESYLDSGTPQPEKDRQLAAEIQQTGDILDGIETLHTFKIDRLANYQLVLVADLRRRWNDAKAKLDRRYRG
jgi:hypothetical protein